ncbi:hypothetical protein NMY22_g6346 [Coprinellus aureogranulatus]|nr:hypothetical protein NMY22_g6346 [Coprinellus aureogranulatus]
MVPSHVIMLFSAFFDSLSRSLAPTHHDHVWYQLFLLPSSFFSLALLSLSLSALSPLQASTFDHIIHITATLSYLSFYLSAVFFLIAVIVPPRTLATPPRRPYSPVGGRRPSFAVATPRPGSLPPSLRRLPESFFVRNLTGPPRSLSLIRKESMIPSSSDTVFIDTLHLSACIGPDCWGKTRAQPLSLSLYLNLEERYLVESGETDEVEKSVHYGQSSPQDCIPTTTRFRG